MAPLVSRGGGGGVGPGGRLAFHPLVVEALDQLTPRAVSVTWSIPEELADAFVFRAGQYVTVQATIDGAPVRRSYSICRSPGEVSADRRLQVAIGVVPGGRMSTYVAQRVSPGEVLAVAPPMGSFGCDLRPGASRHHCAIVAGSGITPIMSIVSAVLAGEPSSQVTVVFANRDAESVMFRDELARLTALYPGRLTVFHVLSRGIDEGLSPPPVLPGQISWTSGRLSDALLTSVLAEVDDLRSVQGSATASGSYGGVDEWYLCGPAAVVALAAAHLAARGVGDARVHREAFVDVAF